MGRSFFLGTDAELYTGSKAFSTQITATPTAFGLTAANASAYAALNSAYEAAYLAANNAETRTKGAVQAKRDAKIALKAMASDLAKIIDGTATVTDQQKLDLGLSVRATPGPRPAPGACTGFTVSLNGDGSVLLKWKSQNPAGAPGTMYQVWRRLGAGGGAFTYLGGTGSKHIVDNEVPAGTAAVTYQIQAVRSTAVGPWSQFNVNFGAPGTPATVTATVTEATPKLAA